MMVGGTSILFYAMDMYNKRQLDRLRLEREE